MSALRSHALTRASKLLVRKETSPFKISCKEKKGRKDKIILCIKWLELQCFAVCFLLTNALFQGRIFLGFTRWVARRVT